VLDGATVMYCNDSIKVINHSNNVNERMRSDAGYPQSPAKVLSAALLQFKGGEGGAKRRYRKTSFTGNTQIWSAISVLKGASSQSKFAHCFRCTITSDFLEVV